MQAVVLVPLTLGVLFSLLQWSLSAWAQSTALAAAQEGARAAGAHGGSAAGGRSAAATAAQNGSLMDVKVRADRGTRVTEVTVSGVAVTVLWPAEISATARVATERLTGS